MTGPLSFLPLVALVSCAVLTGVPFSSCKETNIHLAFSCLPMICHSCAFQVPSPSQQSFFLTFRCILFRLLASGRGLTSLASPSEPYQCVDWPSFSPSFRPFSLQSPEGWNVSLTQSCWAPFSVRMLTRSDCLQFGVRQAPSEREFALSPTA